ncbi:hypothetical protein OGATHE_001696 [Ogataea polymorpha]|uniref:Uncharacterized protein n=1 Tax=Ogataea polymorpha TaxID=460523 RepID=A0A9P8PNL1_9ASCO|nr:hypothetical protein OGATHE_001696 [Ogataea polymorpha]
MDTDSPLFILRIASDKILDTSKMTISLASSSATCAAWSTELVVMILSICDSLSFRMASPLKMPCVISAYTYLAPWSLSRLAARVIVLEVSARSSTTTQTLSWTSPTSIVVATYCWSSAGWPLGALAGELRPGNPGVAKLTLFKLDVDGLECTISSDCACAVSTFCRRSLWIRANGMHSVSARAAARFAPPESGDTITQSL